MLYVCCFSIDSSEDVVEQSEGSSQSSSHAEEPSEECEPSSQTSSQAEDAASSPKQRNGLIDSDSDDD